MTIAHTPTTAAAQIPDHFTQSILAKLTTTIWFFLSRKVRLGIIDFILHLYFFLSLFNHYLASDIPIYPRRIRFPRVPKPKKSFRLTIKGNHTATCIWSKKQEKRTFILEKNRKEKLCHKEVVSTHSVADYPSTWAIRYVSSTCGLCLTIDDSGGRAVAAIKQCATWDWQTQSL